MRSLKRVKEVVNKLHSKDEIEEDDPSLSSAYYTYKTYVEDLKVFKPIMDEKERYSKMLLFMNKISDNFEKIFVNTVSKVEGMKLYLLLHTQFDITDMKSRDWFVKFMIKFLQPTKEDFDALSAIENDYINVLSEEIVDVVKSLSPILISDMEDDTIIEFGMWKRNKYDRLNDPINIINYNDFELDLPNIVDVMHLIDSKGILKAVTGELVIMEENVE